MGGAVAGIHMDLPLVIAAGTAGNLAGSYLGWAAGRYGGRAALRRWGHHRWLNKAHLDRAQRWFARHGAASVFYGRLLPVIRSFISLPAGLAGMRPARFGIYTLLGCLPWTTALAGAGYAIGANWRTVAHSLHSPAALIIAGTLAVLIAAATVFIIRRRRARRAGERSTLLLVEPTSCTGERRPMGDH
ncbi:DedA family protein [Mycolicibacter arupensis]|uniref:DedA family protein n=1 Tax=Mycolicibacter arupensis TaxID=342002 RepID=UPI00122CE7A4|nr:DedA family protein [Mycolicibacter arupensis]KAA1430671.1 DedA family protein [Mycolicibacter arupensis]